MKVAYLSRIWLNPLRSHAQSLLRNPHAMHAAVLGGLPRQPVTERVLWRLELNNPHRADLLVLTQSSPSWEHLLEQAGWPSADEPQSVTRPYDTLVERLHIGQEYAFRLCANPVATTRNPAAPSAAQKERLSSERRQRGVLVPHRTVAHQLSWLTDRIENWGFTLLATSNGDPQVQISARERLSFRKSRREGAGGSRVVLQTATYDGRVQIADAAAARTHLLSGVGRGRAYGCGLITLAAPGTGD